MNPNLHCKKVLLCGALSLLIAAQSQAVDRFWINAGSAAWTDGLNWDTGFPASGDNGFINNGGTATIDPSQNVTVTTVVLGSTNTASGNIIMTGGTLITGSDVRVGGNNVTVTGGTSGGAGTFTQGAGDVRLNGGNVNVGFGDTGVGTYNISGGTLLVNVGGIIALGNRGSGTINQSGGSVLARTALTAAISQLNLGRNGAVGASNPGRASGTYTLSSGDLTVGSLRYGNAVGAATGSTNIFNLQGGSLIVSNIAVINTAAANSFNFTAGKLTTASVGLSLTNNGGILNPASLFFGNTTVAAPLTPAQAITSEIGTITFTGTVGYDQAASGTLAIDLMDNTATGKDFLSIGVGGSATLLGTIAVSLLNGFDPTPGSTFDILTAGTIQSGAVITGSTPGGFGFDSSILAGGNGQVLRLTVVPEPGTVALLALPGLMFFIRCGFRKS